MKRQRGVDSCSGDCDCGGAVEWWWGRGGIA